MVKLVPSWKTRVSCCFCQVNMKSALDPGFPDLPLEESSFQNGLLNKYSVECYKIFLLFSCFYRNFTLKFLSGYYIEQLTPLGSFLLHPTPGQKFFIFFFFLRFRHNDNLTCFRKSEEESSQSNATCSPSGTLSLQFYLQRAKEFQGLSRRSFLSHSQASFPLGRFEAPEKRLQGKS